MHIFRWLLYGLMGWTMIGALGTAVAWAKGDRAKAVRNMRWLVGAWCVYIALLVGINKSEKQRVVALGQEECFDKVCFAVVGVAAVGEFKGGGGGRLVQVGVRVRNGGLKGAEAEGVRAYLVDERGRRWEQTRGVGGIALTVRLPPGGSAVSQPVFRLEGGARAFGVVLTRGRSGWGWLTIGDTDGVLHRPTMLRLE